MITDTKSPSMRVALQQIYVNLYVEYGRCKTSSILRRSSAERSISLGF